MSNLSSIGFPVQTHEQFERLAVHAASSGEPLGAQRGTYFRWSAGTGAELWAQVNRDRDLVGLNPHFSGDARMRISLEERVERPDATDLDGAFYGWARPGGTYQDSVAFPLVFDAPDYDLHRTLELPAVLDVQLTGFAREMSAFADEGEYYASQAEPHFAAESFVPSGLFQAEGEAIDPPEALAIFSGRVLRTSPLTNLVTGTLFYWAKVRTLGGEVDVVADPRVVDGTLVVGGVVSGWFWLSGRLPLNYLSATSLHHRQ